MYSKALYDLIHEKKITDSEAARVIKVTHSGYKNSLQNGACKFDHAIQLMNHYNISLSDIISYATGTQVSEPIAEYTRQNTVPVSYYNEMKESLQDHIISLKEQIAFLKEQVK